ncbi:unnamed protein product, partial [Ectocarpus sp. 13 AM-2016]
MISKSGQGLTGLIYLLAIGLVFGTLESQVYGQTITDTEDTQLRSEVPPLGWTLASGTSDASDSTTWGWFNPTFNWIGGPYPPPTGHTYFLTAGNWIAGGEIVTSAITGLVPGVDYTFTFYVAGFRSTYGPNTVVGNNYRIIVGNDDSGTVSFSSTGWTERTFTFTADATTENIAIFGHSTGTDNANTHFSFDSDAVT